MASLEEAQWACGWNGLWQRQALNEPNRLTPPYQSWSSYCVSIQSVGNRDVMPPIWHYSFRRTTGHLVSTLLHWILLILEGLATQLHRDICFDIPIPELLVSASTSIWILMECLILRHQSHPNTIFLNFLYIYFWLCWVFVAAQGLFSSCWVRATL